VELQVQAVAQVQQVLLVHLEQLEIQVHLKQAEQVVVLVQMVLQVLLA
jgi:hypothetical protein